MRAEELWEAGLWNLEGGDRSRGLRQGREAMHLDPHNGRYVSEYREYAIELSAELRVAGAEGRGTEVEVVVRE